MNLPVTSFTALPLGMLMIGLAYRVATLRIRNKIGIGVGSNRTLAKAREAHGNAVENIPLMLFLLAIAELQNANTWLLAGLAGVFVIARLMNASGVSQHTGRSFGRFYGTLLSWFVTIFLGLLNVWLNLAS
ncbi:MAG: MAPEG family protein [Gammaproteobacteria bacterium]|nr:MAPEG family protein [Gammaproteobacteria bacterium]